MPKLVGFAGSLRAESFNRTLLAAAARLVPDGTELEILPIDDVPLYNADLERDRGIPRAVRDLKEGIAAADGLVIATPEYNWSIPGVAKNVIDWVSRPPEDQGRVLHGKPVALIGASPGGFGTFSAQADWLKVLRTLRMHLWVDGGPFYVSRAADSIADGRVDAAIEERLAAYLAGFAASLERGG